MASKTTALANSEEPRGLLPIPPAEFREVMESIMAPGEKLDVLSLPTVKIPAGGGRNWELPDGQSVAELTGVIMIRQPVRAYWHEEFTGGGSPPDCASTDNVTGIGTPGGSCEHCPLNEFGSGKDNAKACRQITRLFLLREGDILPTLVPLPPSAYKVCQQHNLSVAQKGGRKLWHVRTGITLAQTKSTGGITYSVPIFRVVENLPVEQQEEATAYRNAWLPAVSAMAVREEV